MTKILLLFTRIKQIICGLAEAKNYIALKYLIQKRYSNNDGLWNEKGKTLTLIILPPWWKTTFAYLGYFFFFVGIVFGIDRVQRRRIVNKERNAAAIKEAFSYERVKKTIKEIGERSAEEIIEHLKSTAKEWSGGKVPDDDITVVVIKVK